MAFTVSKIYHICVACKDLDISKKFYTDILGLECTGEEAVPSQGVKTVFIKCGPNLIELLVDITENNDGPIGKYIAKNGQGIQHVALLVDDLVAAIADVQAKRRRNDRQSSSRRRRRNGHCVRSSEICWHPVRALHPAQSLI